jgi:hypothetical protein
MMLIGIEENHRAKGVQTLPPNNLLYTTSIV